MILLNIHVPKTGGTSVRKALESSYSVQRFYDGELKPAKVTPQVLCGHIKLSRARDMFPGVPTVAFVRTPYEQVRSNYAHYLNHPETEFDPEIGVLPSGLSFEEFIEYEPLRNYQSQFVDSSPSYLGATENLSGHILNINRLLGLSIPLPRPFNKSKVSVERSKRCDDLIDKYYELDWELYRGVRPV